MKIAYADPSRSAHSSHSPTGKALSHEFSALHHSSSSTLLCSYLGWMTRARQTFPVLALLRQEANIGRMVQLSLSASSLASLLNQAQSPSALSRILTRTSVTSTAHVAELGLLLCTVQYVQAVRAWGRHFAMSLSIQFWAQICGTSPIQCPEILQHTDY